MPDSIKESFGRLRAQGGFGLWMAALFLLAFCLYVCTAPPEFLFDDNPEFITSAFTLGIPHPPGYPLFSLIGKLTAALTAAFPPLGINLASALFGALGACMLGRAIWRLTDNSAAAATFVLFFIVSPIYWSQAIEAEVYAPNVFLTGLLMNFVVEFDRKRDPRLLAAICCAGALTIVTHYTAVIVLPVIAVYLIATHRRDLSPFRSAAAPGIFVFFATLAILYYLPLRAAADPAANWGAADTLSGFFKHLRGVETMSGAPHVAFAEKLKFAGHYFKLAFAQAPWPCFLFLIPAAAGLFRRRGQGIFIAGLFLTLVSGFIFGLNYLYGPRGAYVVSFFHITSFFFLFLIIGIGAAEGLTWTPQKPGSKLRYYLLLIPAALITYSAVRSLPHVNKAHEHIAPDYARNMLLTLDRDSAIFSPNVVESFPLVVMRGVYGIRPDILIYGKQGDADKDVELKTGAKSIMQSGGAQQAKQASILESLAASNPVYFTMGAVINRPDLFPMLDGLLYKLHTGSVSPLDLPDRWNRYQMRGLDLKRKDYDYLTKYVVSKYYLLRGADYMQRSLDNRADDMFGRLLKFNPESQFLRLSLATLYLRKGRIDDALEQYEAAMDLPPEEVEASLIALAIYNNAGELYRAKGRWNSAIRAFKEARKLAPNDPLVHFQLGRTYFEYAEWLLEANRNREAFDAYKSAITSLVKTDKLGGGNESVYTVLGVCFEQTGDYVSAETFYRRAMDPYGEGGKGDPEVFRHAGIFYADKLGQYDKATKMFENYLGHNPVEGEQTTLVRIKLSSIYVHLKNYTKAIEHLTKAASNFERLSPYHQTAIRYYGALAYDGRGEKDKALLMFIEGAKKETELPEMHRDFGRFLEKRYGKHKEAIEEMQKYLLLVPGAQDRISVEGEITVIRNKMNGVAIPAAKPPAVRPRRGR